MKKIARKESRSFEKKEKAEVNFRQKRTKTRRENLRVLTFSLKLFIERVRQFGDLSLVKLQL